MMILRQLRVATRLDECWEDCRSTVCVVQVPWCAGPGSGVCLGGNWEGEQGMVFGMRRGLGLAGAQEEFCGVGDSLYYIT
ncbi:hypothetical protein M758_5G122600 [Ceratodon purpureus]|nr:hypothetical protein M758_5G122600 [Ceratodon purpureus]